MTERQEQVLATLIRAALQKSGHEWIPNATEDQTAELWAELTALETASEERENHK